MNGKVLKSHPKNTRLQLISPTTVSFKQLKRERERKKKKKKNITAFENKFSEKNQKKMSQLLRCFYVQSESLISYRHT